MTSSIFESGFRSINFVWLLKFSIDKVFTKSILNVRRRIGTINHSFVKGEMSSLLDLPGSRINIECVAQRVSVPEEDSRTSMDIEFHVSGLGGQSVEATTKDTKQGCIESLASADGVGRITTVAMR